MRLVCPNCDAEYEVDERVIPDAGRDVQCSNCGHAWFQHPDGFEEKPSEASGSDAGGEDDPKDADPQEPEAQAAIDALIRDDSDTPQEDDGEDHVEDDAIDSDEDPKDDSDSDHSDAPEDDVSDDTDHGDAEGGDRDGSDHDDDSHDDGNDDAGDDTDEDSDGDSAPDDTPEDTPEPRELDEGVRDILRQEAELETQARETDREGLETQDELGLGESPALEAGGQAAQERMARLRGLDVDDTNAAGGSGARRDLLPDIEEINSSLAPIGSNDIDDDFAELDAAKSGFSRGFAIMLLVAVLIVGLYIFAPWISEKVPALASIMDSYVGLINGLRDWLDRMVQAALAKMK